MEALRKLARQYRRFTPQVATTNLLYALAEGERRRCFGPNHPKETFYVIRCVHRESPFYTGPVLNLMANYAYVLSHLHYAREKGWRPVVDQLHYPVYNSQATPVNGSQNPWEYYWTQPDGVSLDEVYRSRHVVLSRRNWISEWNLGYDLARHQDPATIRRLRALSDWAPLNAPTAAYVEARWRETLQGRGKVLGVSYRFSGHARSSPHQAPDHPIQPEMDALLQTVEARAAAWGMDALFLATESDDAVERFRRAWGERLIVLPRVRQRERDYGGMNYNPLYAPGAMAQTTLDYLTEMELLSRCSALLGSLTSGLRYAIIRNGLTYTHLEILDCGRFADPRQRAQAKEGQPCRRS